jgi:hypothetical protein
LTIPNSVTNIGDDAFWACSTMTNLTIGTNVVTVGAGAFGYCSKLTSLNIPDSVREIGSEAFDNCSSVTSLSIGSNVLGIGNEAFFNCALLTGVTIPNSVASIGTEAFCYCQSLTNITIPGSVASIGYEAFEFCQDLTGAYFTGNAPVIIAGLYGSNVFGNNSTNAKVYYLPGTAGWGSTFGGLPTALWASPEPLILGPGFNAGEPGSGFSFNIFSVSNIQVIVEACTNLANPVWEPILTNTMTNSLFVFYDPAWTNYSRRFYRITSP